MKISMNFKNINAPAPKAFRKFENAYCIMIAPALAAAVQGWGLDASHANRWMIVLTFSVALVKGTGMMLANGETYTKPETDTDATGS